MLVRFAELIANVGRDTRLDSTGAQTNQEQSDCEHRPLPDGNSPGSGHAGERKIAQAVNERERQDGPIFAEQTVGNDRAKNREKVNAENEVMRVHVGFVRAHRREHTGLIQDVMRHENGQHRFHPVVGEALRRFVADDVRHSRRHAGEIRRRREVFVFGPVHVISFA